VVRVTCPVVAAVYRRLVTKMSLFLVRFDTADIADALPCHTRTE